VAALLGRARDVPRRPPPRPAQALRPRPVPLPVRRRSARRASRGVHRHRHPGAGLAHARLRRAAPDGLGRVRPAGRAARDRDRAASRGDDGEQHRHVQAPAQDARLQLRLVAGDRHHRSGLRALDAVDLPPAVPARARLPGDGARQLVPRARHRARQRGSRRRQERARRPSRLSHAAPPVDAGAISATRHRSRTSPGPRGTRPSRSTT
jgi:hypothetical protein